MGFLQLVGQRGEGAEADPAALLAGADSQGGREVRFAGAAVADEDHRLAVADPGALGEGGDRGLRDLRVVSEAEVLQALERGEPRVEQAPSLASLCAFGGLGFEQRSEVGSRGLLLAGGFLGQAAEAALDRWELELGGVRFDEGFHRRGAGLLGRRHDRPPISLS